MLVSGALVALASTDFHIICSTQPLYPSLILVFLWGKKRKQYDLLLLASIDLWPPVNLLTKTLRQCYSIQFRAIVTTIKS